MSKNLSNSPLVYGLGEYAVNRFGAKMKEADAVIEQIRKDCIKSAKDFIKELK
jgi:hypothetical protein